MNDDLLISTRKRRHNAGSRLKQLIELEEHAAQSASHLSHVTDDDENLNLLFQEDDNDDEFIDLDIDNENLDGIDDVNEDSEAPDVSDSDAKPSPDNLDDVLSESDISASDSDQSEGERELATQERSKKRAKRLSHVPAIKKAVPAPAVSHKKQKTLLISSESLLLSDRRSSSRSAALENKQALVQRLKESEERRAKFIPIIRHKEAELTQQQKLHEAIETERLNVLSLNQFREQEFVKKEHQRNAFLSKRKKLRNVIRLISRESYVSPTVEIAHARRAHYLQGKTKKRPGRRRKFQPEPVFQRLPGEIDLELPAVKRELEQARLEQEKREQQALEKSKLEQAGQLDVQNLHTSPAVAKSPSDNAGEVPASPIQSQSVEGIGTQHEIGPIFNDASAPESNADAMEVDTKGLVATTEKVESDTVKHEQKGVSPHPEVIDIDKKDPSLPAAANQNDATHAHELTPETKDPSAPDEVIPKDDTYMHEPNTVSTDVKKHAPSHEPTAGAAETDKKNTSPKEASLEARDADEEPLLKPNPTNEKDTVHDPVHLSEQSTMDDAQNSKPDTTSSVEISSKLHSCDKVAGDTADPLVDPAENNEIPARRATSDSEITASVPDLATAESVEQATGLDQPGHTTEIAVKIEEAPSPAASRETTPAASGAQDLPVKEVFEGPDQKVGRNLIHFLDFDEDDKTMRIGILANMKTILFGPQALLPALRRFKDVKTVARIGGTDNPYAVAPLSNDLFEPVTKISSDDAAFDELRKLPRLGVAQDIVEEVEQDTKDEAVQIVIEHEAPTGLYLPNGNKKPCLITGTEVKYFDPNNGIPYSSVETYRFLKQIEQGLVPWYSIPANQDDAGPVELYLGARDGSTRHAKGVPEGFDA